MSSANSPLTNSFTPPPIPTDSVHFRVEVDRTRCSSINPEIDARLATFEHSGIQMTIAEIVIRAGLHFSDAVVDRGEGLELAQIRHAWSWLMDWELEAVAHGHDPERTVLRVANQPNSRVNASRCEVIAFGVALEVAIRLYNIAYEGWELSEGLAAHDLQAFQGVDANGALIRVEVRGRLDRTNVRSAVDHVHDKFDQADFSQAAGVLVFPRTTNRSRSADIIVLDPAGDRVPDLPSNRYRIILRHYAPFFYYQGGLTRRFGERLRELADSDDASFNQYLNDGDRELSNRRTRYARTRFTWNGEAYVGTVWDGIAWPKWLAGMESPSGGGIFFWGLSLRVIEALRDGQLQLLLNNERKTQIIREATRMVVILSDRTALLWAPTRSELEILDEGASV